MVPIYIAKRTRDSNANPKHQSKPPIKRYLTPSNLQKHSGGYGSKNTLVGMGEHFALHQNTHICVGPWFPFFRATQSGYLPIF